jgi:hypothetical protein
LATLNSSSITSTFGEVFSTVRVLSATVTMIHLPVERVPNNELDNWLSKLHAGAEGPGFRRPIEK